MDADQEQFLRPLMAFLDVSNKESDRGKVLVVAAQIDGMLEDILRAFLINGKQSDALFDGPNAPCSSMFNKANIAVALGLISQSEFEEIEIIRRIRNEFAHSVHRTMQDPRIADRIACLEIGLERLIEIDDPAIADPKTRFSMSSVSLVSSLYNRAHYVSKRSANCIDWPQ
jgi:hypothetical protein